MVECEYQQLRFSQKINYVLIDTWWNVNIEELEQEAIETAF